MCFDKTRLNLEKNVFMYFLKMYLFKHIVFQAKITKIILAVLNFKMYTHRNISTEKLLHRLHVHFA